jgi:hypothetical protein
MDAVGYLKCINCVVITDGIILVRIKADTVSNDLGIASSGIHKSAPFMQRITIHVLHL